MLAGLAQNPSRIFKRAITASKATSALESFGGPRIGLKYLKSQLPILASPSSLNTQPLISPSSKSLAHMSTLSDLEPPLKKRRVEEDVVISEPMDLDATLPSIGPSIEATQANKSSKRKGRGKGKVFPREIYGEDGVRWKEIVSIVGEDYVEKISQQGKDWDIPEYLKITEEHEGGIREVDVKVVKLAFNGQALSIPINSTGLPGDNNEPKWVVAHSFALPGETCRVAVHHNSRLHSDARLLQVLSSPAKTAIGDPVPSQTILTVDPKYHRDESQIRCPHFMTCGGCQFQYLPYPSQLAIKRDELVQAYSNFYSLSQKLSSSAPIERISAEVHGSAKQYGYRTKITPHFESAPKALLKQMGKPALDGRRKKLIPPPPETSSSKNRNVKGWNPTSEDVESSLCSSYLDGKDNLRVLEQLRKNKLEDDNFIRKNYVEELEQLSIQTDEAGNELHNGPKPSWMKIGFTSVRNHNLDIEECPLATQLMNETYKVARKEIARTFYSYQNGATLIYRDGLDPSPVIRQITVGLEEPESLPGSEGPISAPPSPKVFSKDLVLEPACVSSPTARMREKVGDYFFEYSASSFFQCNHIILEDLVEYVRAAIFSTVERTENLTHLVDTYCGAGLFAICLYPHFKSVVGIELTEESIYFAKHNAWLNGMDRGRIRFQAGDASDIFAGIRKQWAPSMTKVATKQASKAQLLREEHYPGILREPRATDPVAQAFLPDTSVVIMDPPRKGSSPEFISQLLSFGPDTIVYVSCNSITQARDVGWIVRGSCTEDEGSAEEQTRLIKLRGYRYELESVKGFDLFPQTAHIESVAVLRKVRI